MSSVAPNTSSPGKSRYRVVWWSLPVIVVAGLAGLALFFPDSLARWRQLAAHWTGATEDHPPATTNADLDHDHASHDQADDGHASHHHADHDHSDHDHPGHSETNSLEMSEQARKNIGLRIATVELGPFVKTIGVPGMVAERPGQSSILVTAPMTGVITRIHVIEGEAIEPGHKLFDIRLTHEELVQSQAELLQTAEELGVTEREIKRIERLTESGTLPGKQLLERNYERQKQEAVLHSKREALLLHGLSESQIDTILEKRQLLKELSVVAPSAAAPDQGSASALGDATSASAGAETGVFAGGDRGGDVGAKQGGAKQGGAKQGGAKQGGAKRPPFQVRGMKAAPGQHVNAGDTLVVLVDHAELYIQGEAFERDIEAISRAADANADVSAVLETEGERAEVVDNLRVLYLAADIDPDSRTLDFFVTLPNQVRRDATLPNGHRFFAWRFRPGQRVQLQIPVETMTDRLVLPVEAVAQDGAETYVFTPNGNHFDRRAVHVEYRDSRWAVVANDGSLFAGEKVAVSGAQQLQLALKNKAGGGIDPHAGHSH